MLVALQSSPAPSSPVGVLEKELANEVPENIGLLLQTVLELGQRLLPLQSLESVLVVDPRSDGAQHEAEAAGEPAGVVLPERELDRVDGRLDGGLREALVCEALRECAREISFSRSGAVQADILAETRPGVLQFRRWLTSMVLRTSFSTSSHLLGSTPLRPIE